MPRRVVAGRLPAVVLAGWAVLAAALPARGATDGPSLTSPPEPLPGLRAPGPDGERFDAALADRAVAALRAAAETGRTAPLFEALLAAGPRTSASTAATVLASPSVPPVGFTTPAALDRLVAATLSADRAARAAVAPADLDRVRGLVAEGLLAGPSSAEARGVATELRSLADTGRIVAAAPAVLAAVDALLAVARAAPATDRPAPACDLVDQAPALCVSSAADNTYDEEAAVTLDLGGDDTYLTGAGAGSCLGSNASVQAERCAAVLVDLAGDDTYRLAPKDPTCGISVCGQGVGLIGVGVLVDAAGHDRYESIGVLKNQPEFNCYETVACGAVAAHGTGLIGVGVLADLAGHDHYLAAFHDTFVGSDGVEAPESITAQGAGVFGGVGLLLDTAGHDAYGISGHATGYADPDDAFLPWTFKGWSSYSGQGEGAFGLGALVDTAGDDRISIEVEPDPEAAHRTGPSPWGQGGVAGTFAQGVSTALALENNIGLLLLGPGDAEVSQRVTARLGFPSGLTGQAYGLFGGAIGVLDDAGGDEAYRLAATLDATITERCDCDELKLVLDANADIWIDFYGLGRALVVGQGGPQGGLRDRGGNDAYEASARSNLRVLAENERPGGTATAGVTLLGSSWVSAQGLSSLRDDSGDDRYTLHAERHLSAVAHATPAEAGGESSELAWARPAIVVIYGQSVGEGTLLEDSGGRDRYEATYRADAEAHPDPGGHDTDGPSLVAVQGTDGKLHDFDAGQADAFHADSALVFDTCVGRFGEGPGWVSGPTLRGGTCSPTWGETVATSTVPAGADTKLTFLEVVPGGEEDFPYLDVAVRLDDAGGAPLPHRRVVVAPEFGFTSPDPLVDALFEWVDATAASADLVTDEHGVARGRLAMHQTYCEQGCTGLTGAYRLRAITFGEAGAYRPGRGYSQVLGGGS